jgi:DNA-binding beta-propeller fold protein YncE
VHPTAIAFDPVRREILVSDYGEVDDFRDPRVQIFDESGNLVASISGKAGMIGYRFYRPQGLAVDAAGRILLVDAWSGQVLILDRTTGETVSTLGGYGTDPGELMLPLDLVIAGESSDVFVTNNRPGRIEVFAEGGALR